MIGIDKSTKKKCLRREGIRSQRKEKEVREKVKALAGIRRAELRPASQSGRSHRHLSCQIYQWPSSWWKIVLVSIQVGISYIYKYCVLLLLLLLPVCILNFLYDLHFLLLIMTGGSKVIRSVRFSSFFSISSVMCTL